MREGGEQQKVQSVHTKFMISSQTHQFTNRYTFLTFHCGEIQEIGNRDFFIN